MNLSDEWYGRILSLPGLVLTILLVVTPVAIIFGLSFFRFNFIEPVEFIGLDNYRAVLSDRLLVLALKKTIIYTLGVTTISLAGSLIVVTGLGRIGQGRFSTLYRVLAILPWAIPLVLSGLIWRWLLDPTAGILTYMVAKIVPFVNTQINIFGGENRAMLAVIIADAWTKMPFMTILLLPAVDGINEELYESARIDGANLITTFRKITLPLARKGILYAVILTSMLSFNTITAIWVITKGGPGNATYHVGIYLIDNLIRYVDLSRASVVGIVIFLCIVVSMGGLFYWMSKEL